MSRRYVMYGFTLLELLVVVTVVAILLGLLIPTMVRARERSRRTVCKDRAKTFGLAFSMYAFDYDEFYPTRGLNLAVGANDLRALGSLSLIFDEYVAARRLFVCPSTRDDPNDLRVGLNVDRIQGLITAKPAGCSYGYDSQKANLSKLKVVGDALKLVAILADKPNPSNRLANSPNHGNTGQNVLYFDGHVRWAATPNAGLAGDHIWLHWRYGGPQAVLAYSDSYITQ